MFVNSGIELLRAEFDPEFFRRRYGLGEEPAAEQLFEQYLRNVTTDALDPNHEFSEAGYLASNPDVNAAVTNGDLKCGFHHWVLYGKAEGRRWTIERDKISIHFKENFPLDLDLLTETFDAECYQRATGTNIREPDALLQDFLTTGLEAGIVPTDPSKFDEEFYLSYYQDVLAAKNAGLLPSGYYHYLKSGHDEGRRPVYEMGTLLERKMGGTSAPSAIPNTEEIGRRIKPVKMRVSKKRLPTINIFIPSIDPDIMFGGYIAYFQFLCRLAERGYHLRFIVLEDQYVGSVWFFQKIQNRPRWVAAFTSSEFVNITGKDELIEFNPNDLCFSYSTWTTLDAWSVAEHLNFKKVVFFLQEFEPIFYEYNAYNFMTASAYRVPHIPLFNSHFLAKYFKQMKFGVFLDNDSPSHLVFNHALADISPRAEYSLAKDRTKRLLFYARPEKHAARNMFEICILALREAFRKGIFRGNWEFCGIGSLGKDYTISLNDKTSIKIISRIEQSKYEAMLQSFDVGLSLMWAPHPSVFPFELAKAGVVTVTNTFPNRSMAELEQFGFNIVPAEPTLHQIVAGLAEAVRRAEQPKKRIHGAKFDWPTSWDMVFDSKFLDELETTLTHDGAKLSGLLRERGAG